MNNPILPILAVGLTTALMAQAEERPAPLAQAPSQLWQLQIRGIGG